MPPGQYPPGQDPGQDPGVESGHYPPVEDPPGQYSPKKFDWNIEPVSTSFLKCSVFHSSIVHTYSHHSLRPFWHVQYIVESVLFNIPIPLTPLSIPYILK